MFGGAGYMLAGGLHAWRGYMLGGGATCLEGRATCLQGEGYMLGGATCLGGGGGGYMLGRGGITSAVYNVSYTLKTTRSK